MTDFLTSAEAGERLGVKGRQVVKLARMGRVPCVKHGRCLRFPRAAWDTWIAEQNAEALAGVKEKSRAINSAA